LTRCLSVDADIIASRQEQGCDTNDVSLLEDVRHGVLLRRKKDIISCCSHISLDCRRSAPCLFEAHDDHVCALFPVKSPASADVIFFAIRGIVSNFGA
jgi:hypothetical protein